MILGFQYIVQLGWHHWGLTMSLICIRVKWQRNVVYHSCGTDPCLLNIRTKNRKHFSLTDLAQINYSHPILITFYLSFININSQQSMVECMWTCQLDFVEFTVIGYVNFTNLNCVWQLKILFLSLMCLRKHISVSSKRLPNCISII